MWQFYVAEIDTAEGVGTGRYVATVDNHQIEIRRRLCNCQGGHRDHLSAVACHHVRENIIELCESLPSSPASSQ